MGGGKFLWQIIMYITDKRMRRPDYQWVTSTLSKYAQTLTGFAMSSDISLSTFASVASWQILTRSTVATRSIIAFIYIFNKTNTIYIRISFAIIGFCVPPVRYKNYVKLVIRAIVGVLEKRENRLFVDTIQRPISDKL